MVLRYLFMLRKQLRIMFGQGRRSIVLVIVVTVIVSIIVLSAPMIPVESTVTQTRTRNLRYDAQVYGNNLGFFVPRNVQVTNKDSIGGSFSVTLNMWYNRLSLSGTSKELRETKTQSQFIDAGATETFDIPRLWTVIEPMYSFTYSVTAPTTQENYDVTKTEYKSILSIFGNP